MKGTHSECHTSDRNKVQIKVKVELQHLHLDRRALSDIDVKEQSRYTICSCVQKAHNRILTVMIHWKNEEAKT